MPAIIPITPERIGFLTETEARAFSQPFSPDWAGVKSRSIDVDGEKIFLTEEDLAMDNFNLPDSYSQFIPVIAMCAKHEKSVRDELIFGQCAVSIRQWNVRAGETQQESGVLQYLHRDLEIADFAGRFYSVSDTMSARYYPHLEAEHSDKETVRISEIDENDYIDFSPYEMVHASSRVLHCSPTMPQEIVRTFTRVAFTYRPKSIYRR